MSPQGKEMMCLKPIKYHPGFPEGVTLERYTGKDDNFHYTPIGLKRALELATLEGSEVLLRFQDERYSGSFKVESGKLIAEVHLTKFSEVFDDAAEALDAIYRDLHAFVFCDHPIPDKDLNRWRLPFSQVPADMLFAHEGSRDKLPNVVLNIRAENGIRGLRAGIPLLVSLREGSVIIEIKKAEDEGYYFQLDGPEKFEVAGLEYDALGKILDVAYYALRRIEKPEGELDFTFDENRWSTAAA